MRHSYKIIKADIGNVQAENEDFIDVKIALSLDEEPLMVDHVVTEAEIKADPKSKAKAGDVVKAQKEMKFSFAMDAGKEAIETELNDIMLALDRDLEIVAENAERDAARAKAKNTINELMGTTELTAADVPVAPVEE